MPKQFYREMIQQYFKACLYSINTCLLWYRSVTHPIRLKKRHTHTVPWIWKYNSFVAMVKSFSILAQNTQSHFKTSVFYSGATKKAAASLVLNVLLIIISNSPTEDNRALHYMVHIFKIKSQCPWFYGAKIVILSLHQWRKNSSASHVCQSTNKVSNYPEAPEDIAAPKDVGLGLQTSLLLQPLHLVNNQKYFRLTSSSRLPSFPWPPFPLCWVPSYSAPLECCPFPISSLHKLSLYPYLHNSLIHHKEITFLPIINSPGQRTVSVHSRCLIMS